MVHAPHCRACQGLWPQALPGCGVRLCPHCNATDAAAAANTSAQLAGVVQAPQLPAGWHLGLEGRWDGETFVLAGVCVRCTEAGWQWREWHIFFAQTQRWAYLSEAKGKLWLLGRTAVTPWAVPPSKVGDVVTLEATPYDVLEVGVARLVAAAGQLQHPDDLRIEAPYADCRGPQDAVATIDLDDAGTAYLGQVVDPTELGLPPWAVAGRTVQCPKCNAQVLLRDGQNTEVASCSHCRILLALHDGAQPPDILPMPPLADVSMLPLTGEVVTPISGEPMPRLELGLGLSGMLRQHQVTVIGCLRRKARRAGFVFAWYEYALVDAAGEYSWLAHNQGHWTFFTPVDQKQAEALQQQKAYKRVDSGEVYIDAAVGEFNWPLRLGATSFTEDAAAPPDLVSSEADDRNVVWSHGVYLPYREVEKAFSIKVREKPRGTAPHQPWTHSGYLKTCLFFVLATWAIWAVGHARGETVFKATLPVATQADAQSGQTFFTEPFTLRSWRNVVVQASMWDLPMNSWADVQGDLVNQQTGLVVPWDADLGRWSGVDEGVAWAEATLIQQRYLAAVQEGRYVLRVNVQRSTWDKPTQLNVQVDQGVPDNTAFAYYMGFHACVLGLWCLMRLRHDTQRLEDIVLGPRHARWARP